MNIKKRADEIYEEIVRIRRDIHQHPELGQEEYRTSKIIKEYLNRYNIENYKCTETGVVGIIRGESPGKTIGVRADIDALPIEEETELEYKSINKGIMHACGHDAHTAILLGVGRILKEMEKDLKGNVKLFFQPSEETIGGALPMIREGCMENPKVDYVIGLHVFPNIETGYIQVTYDKMNASTDDVIINIRGKAGHGAYPHDTIDAITISGQVITGIQTLVSRSISPLDSVVFSIGRISGGTANNIIADKVNMSGTLRTLDESNRKFAKTKIKNIVENTCIAFNGEGSVEFIEGYNALINDKDIIKIIEKKGKEILGENKVIVSKLPSMGAEDFSFFIDEAKGAFFNLGCGEKGKEIIYNGHHPKFEIDEECLKVGMLIQVENTLELLKTEL